MPAVLIHFVLCLLRSEATLLAPHPTMQPILSGTALSARLSGKKLPHMGLYLLSMPAQLLKALALEQEFMHCSSFTDNCAEYAFAEGSGCDVRSGAKKVILLLSKCRIALHTPRRLLSHSR